MLAHQSSRVRIITRRFRTWFRILLVEWDGKYLKYDVRLWMPDGKPSKGITLTKAEAKELHRLLGQELEGLAHEGK